MVTPARDFRYRITGSIVVGPDDAWVLRGDPSSAARARLSLTTCTPKFTSRQRLVAWGDLLPPEQVASVAERARWIRGWALPRPS